MRIDAETLQMRITKLRQLIAACHPIPTDAHEDAKGILELAPEGLQKVEAVIQSYTYNSQILNQAHELLKGVETDIEWAVGTVKGKKLADDIRTGSDIDPNIPASDRLNNRLTKFMLTVIDKDTYLKMFQEFGGEIQGNTAYMDPGEETEAFSQWVIHDKKAPGSSEVVIKLFAQKEMNNLPPDEQSLLKSYLKDWPSIFQVVKINKKKSIYSVKDLLSGKELRFRDKSTSKTLINGSIFIGRAIPFGEDLYYPLGKILELSPKLWKILSDNLNEWSKKYFQYHPSASAQDFFRRFNARIRMKILEIKEDNQESKHDIATWKVKTASEIDAFVRDFKKRGHDIEEIIAAPGVMEYMNSFKRVIDSSSDDEMDYMTNTYEGFYEFTKVLEKLAQDIRDGVINVPR